MNHEDRSEKYRTCEVCGADTGLKEVKCFFWKRIHYEREHPEYAFTYTGPPKSRLQCLQCKQVVEGWHKLVTHYRRRHKEIVVQQKPVDVSVTMEGALASVRALIDQQSDPSVVFWRGQMRVVEALREVVRTQDSVINALRGKLRQALIDAEYWKQVAEGDAARRAAQVLQEAEKAMIVHSSD